MRALLDTNVLIFIAREPERLSPRVEMLLNDSSYQKFYSPVSFWEMAILSSLNRLSVGVPIVEYERLLQSKAGLDLMPIRTVHFQRVTNLPFHHQDPFDRLLVSQAAYEGLAIISSDRIFEKYEEIERIW